MLADLLRWAGAHQALLTWLFAASVVVALLGLILVPIAIARLPADHFVRTEPRPGSWRDRHPALRITLFVLRNALGVVLILAGIAMLALPGQGILTILLGLALVDGPGKRRLELALVRPKLVRRAIDWIRRKAGSPPLRFP
jgi:hypothetical protein